MALASLQNIIADSYWAIWERLQLVSRILPFSWVIINWINKEFWSVSSQSESLGISVLQCVEDLFFTVGTDCYDIINYCTVNVCLWKLGCLKLSEGFGTRKCLSWIFVCASRPPVFPLQPGLYLGCWTGCGLINMLPAPKLLGSFGQWKAPAGDQRGRDTEVAFPGFSLQGHLDQMSYFFRQPALSNSLLWIPVAFLSLCIDVV